MQSAEEGFQFSDGPTIFERMANGRINSPGSIRTATKVIRAFNGSWEAVEKASTPRADGVHVITRSVVEAQERSAHNG